MALFDADFLSRLEKLSLVSRRIVRGQWQARQRTRQLGAGIEFADHREYAAGDDFRYLDWNLYARHGDLLLRRFQEEQDLQVYLLLDCSISMAAVDSAKFDLARQVVAAIAYIALADLDRVSIGCFAAGLIADYPLTRGKGRILSMMRFLEQQQATAPTTSLLDSVTELTARPQRPGLVTLVSDFFDPQGFEAALDKLQHHKYEPHIVQIHSPAEAAPAVLGDVELVDQETGRLRQVTVTEKRVRAYKERFQGFLNRLKAYCSGRGLSCTITDCEADFDQLILSMLREAQQAGP
jgi:uncharacterized protein (DUF58 family)